MAVQEQCKRQILRSYIVAPQHDPVSVQPVIASNYRSNALKSKSAGRRKVCVMFFENHALVSEKNVDLLGTVVTAVAQAVTFHIDALVPIEPRYPLAA